nr:peptide chain release factor N(5)-glutamine methyltransferase [Yoonia sp. F2084L]
MRVLLAKELGDDWPNTIPDPAREARTLLAHKMGVARQDLTLMMQEPLDEDLLDDALDDACDRLRGVPMSHVLGYREFFGRKFSVDNRVLDPRPETEILIIEALSEEYFEVLDLGTGSGVIAITLAGERPNSTVIATDVSSAALEVAAENAAALGVVARMHFECSNWYSAVGGTYDLIVSNPPYIAAEEMDALQPEVRDHEPRIALTDEADGLTAYRAITAGAPDHLMPGGRLIVEIGPTQAQAVSQMMRDAGLQQIRVIPDLDGRDRVVEARKP